MIGSIYTTGQPGRRIARARRMAMLTVKRQCPWAVRVVKVESVVLAFESFEDCPDHATTYDMRHIVVQGVEFKG